MEQFSGHSAKNKPLLHIFTFKKCSDIHRNIKKSRNIIGKEIWMNFLKKYDLLEKFMN